MNNFILKSKKKIKKTFKTTSPLYIVLFTCMLIYVLFLVYLMFWGINTSLKTVGDFNDNVLGLPSQMTFDNFTTIFNNFYVRVNENGVLVPKYIEDMIINTILYALGGAFIQTFVPCVVAYAVTRFNFKFNAVIKGIVIITMILPIIGSAPAEIELLRNLGLYDSIIGNWIQKFHFLGMYFLVFTAAFEVIPKDFAEAAYMDGASEFKLFTKIMFPIVSTVFTTVLLINFIGLWNDYQTPMLYLPTHPTLAYGVFDLSRTTINELNNVPARMAGCVILLVPILIIFIAFRKKIMGNLTLGGVKE